MIKVPETVEGSWCEGEVHVGYKKAVFQPSSALCHVTEVHSILKIGSKSMTTTSHWRAGSTSDLLCSTLLCSPFEIDLEIVLWLEEQLPTIHGGIQLREL